MSKVRTLIAVLPHCAKPLAEMAAIARIRLAFDFPRVERRWDRLSAARRRRIVRALLKRLAYELSVAIGFREEPTEPYDQEVLRLREELFAALEALDANGGNNDLGSREAIVKDVSLANKAAAAFAQKRRVGNKRVPRATAIEWILKHYPGGIPPNLRNAELLDRIFRDTKVRMTERTLRRAQTDIADMMVTQLSTTCP